MAKKNDEVDLLINKKPKVDDEKETENEAMYTALPGQRKPTQLPRQTSSAALASAKSPAAQRLYSPQQTKIPLRTPTKLATEDIEVEAQKIAEAFKAFYGINYNVVTEADEPKVKIPVEPGGMELKKGQDVENVSIEHFKKLIVKDSWPEVSKRIITLKVFNKNKNPTLASKMDKLQNTLAKWVDEKRKENPDFGK